jgi:hypothetical protein
VFDTSIPQFQQGVLLSESSGEAHWPDEALMSSLAEELAKQAE